MPLLSGAYMLGGALCFLLQSAAFNLVLLATLVDTPADEVEYDQNDKGSDHVGI